MKKLLLTSAVLIGAIATAGCDNAQFNSINDQFKTVKQSTTVLQHSSAPAAAMATSLTAVELMNALSNDSAKRAGASGIIATGGGNYEVLQAGGVKTTYTLKSDGTGALTSEKGDKKLIDLTFEYKITESALESSYSLSKLNGTTNGFEIKNAAGTYGYKLSEDKSRQTISATITGELTTASGSSFKLEELSFNHSLPAVNEKKELGSLKINDSGNKLDAKVMIAGATVTASGSFKDKNDNVLYTIEMDENGIKTNETAAADAK
jgi:hypothetical protein